MEVVDLVAFADLADRATSLLSKPFVEASVIEQMFLLAALATVRPDLASEATGERTSWTDIEHWIASADSIALRSPIIGSRVALRPLYPDDVRDLYQAAFAPEGAYRWRYRGRTVSPDAFAAELHNGVLCQFVAVANSSGQAQGIVTAYNADLGSGGISNPLRCERCVGVVVDLTNDFLGVPREPHLLVWVAGSQQAHQSVVLVGGRTFAGDREPASCAPERVVASAAVADGVVLHAAAALIERGVGELHDVERVSDLDGVGQHRVEHRAIRRGQIQGRPLDRSEPRRVAGGEPAARLDAVATRDDVEQLAAADIDDLGAVRV